VLGQIKSNTSDKSGLALARPAPEPAFVSQL